MAYPKLRLLMQLLHKIKGEFLLLSDYEIPECLDNFGEIIV